ncbi:casein kinase-like protein I isoform epsilon, partial [Pavlovales sp. CCMP2436]
GEQWQVGTRVAGGSFGDVYLGRNVLTGQHAAVKLEKARGGNSTSWQQEIKMYKCVTPNPGVPALLWNGTASDGRRGILLELLGPSLDDLFNALQRSISIPTLCAIAMALIDRIAWLHSRGIVHRDVKPQNFLCGRIALDDGHGTAYRPHVAFSPDADDVFVVDFGLAKAFNTRSGHVPFKRHQGRAGTARYASINTHKGHVQSRRDDLEAIGYMLIFLHKGRLPWQGVKASSRRHKHKLICAVKAATPLAELCEGMPHQFGQYIEYTRRLGFSEQPDYEYCKTLFE